MAPTDESTSVDPVPPAPEVKPKAKRARKSNAAKEPKPKKATASKPRTPPTHPPYYEVLFHDRRSDQCKRRSQGLSSQYAIAKFLEDKRKDQLPSNFRKILLVQLKKLVIQGKLSKTKGSYKVAHKVNTEKKPAAPKKPVTAAKPKVSKPAAKPKSAVAKPKPKAAGASKSTTKIAGTKRTAPTKKPSAAKPAAKVAKTPAKASPGAKKPVKKASTVKKPVATKVVKAKTPKNTKSPIRLKKLKDVKTIANLKATPAKSKTARAATVGKKKSK